MLVTKGIISEHEMCILLSSSNFSLATVEVFSHRLFNIEKSK